MHLHHGLTQIVQVNPAPWLGQQQPGERPVYSETLETGPVQQGHPEGLPPHSLPGRSQHILEIE